MTALPFVPGVHFETANVRNLLRSIGIEATEAMCLGIGGGIAAGYQFCPSVQGYEEVQCSGVQFVPRGKMMTTNGAWYRDTISRLGLVMDVRESAGKKAAQTNLESGVSSGKVVVAWTTPLRLSHSINWLATCGMYSVLVHGIADGVVTYSDHVSVRTIDATSFAAARERVCSLKNRTMTIAPGAISSAQWKHAVLEGLRETASDFAKPKLGTFNLPGLKEGAAMINGKGKRSWPVVFPGERLFLPMRDLYESIEIGTGGGLMRPLYADFLEEAASLLAWKELEPLADSYRTLGKQWTAFADFLLPDQFSANRQAMKKLAAGDESQRETLRILQQSPFPWNSGRVDEFRAEAAERLSELYRREAETAARLTAVVQGRESLT
ncbi:MAG TPA: DUF4872 domain-containing protein [Bryobacteraceae bacterium]|nr:DUF4872 domain-containing protein [Bryobacteraceae bacterium]